MKGERGVVPAWEWCLHGSGACRGGGQVKGKNIICVYLRTQLFGPTPIFAEKIAYAPGTVSTHQCRHSQHALDYMTTTYEHAPLAYSMTICPTSPLANQAQAPPATSMLGPQAA